MEEKEKQYNYEYSFAMELMAEQRLNNNRQLKFLYIMLFICITLLSYIFYDRWLDSLSKEDIIAETHITQDDLHNNENIVNNINNSIK